MRKIFSIAAIIFAAVLLPAVVYADEINVTINSEIVDFGNTSPIIVDGRTLVPLRAVFEALGFEVDWMPETSTATLINDDFTVSITVGSDIFTINENEFTLDVAAQIINGSTMLPIRAVIESVGYHVRWNAEANTVVISTTPFTLLQNAYQAGIVPSPDHLHQVRSATLQRDPDNLITTNLMYPAAWPFSIFPDWVPEYTGQGWLFVVVSSIPHDHANNPTAAIIMSLSIYNYDEDDISVYSSILMEAGFEFILDSDIPRFVSDFGDISICLGNSERGDFIQIHVHAYDRIDQFLN